MIPAAPLAAALACLASAANLTLSNEAWDLAPFDGPAIVREADSRDTDVARALDSEAQIRAEIGTLPAFAPRAPRAPKLAPFRLMEPDHLADPVEKVLWAMAARVEGKTDHRLQELPKVGTRVARGRSDAFGLASMPDTQLGLFAYQPLEAPTVRFNAKFERLLKKGVPAEFLGSIAAHELDHADAHFAGDKREELKIETRAFQREAAYLRVIGADRINKKLEAAVAAKDDELSLLYANMALIVEADRQGVLEQYIARAYHLPH